jgi:hypothetical protein
MLPAVQLGPVKNQRTGALELDSSPNASSAILIPSYHVLLVQVRVPQPPSRPIRRSVRCRRYFTLLNETLPVRTSAGPVPPQPRPSTLQTIECLRAVGRVAAGYYHAKATPTCPRFCPACRCYFGLLSWRTYGELARASIVTPGRHRTWRLPLGSPPVAFRISSTT